MEISLKTGIEDRFSSSEFKSTVKLHVLLGKLRNFMEFSHGILKYGLIQFQMDVFLVYTILVESYWYTIANAVIKIFRYNYGISEQHIT